MLAYLAYLCSIPRLGTAIAASSSAYAGPGSAHDVAAQDEHRESVDEIMMNLRKIADLASSPSPAKDRKYSAMNYYGFNATPVQHSEASTLALSDQEASPVTPQEASPVTPTSSTPKRRPRTIVSYNEETGTLE